MVVRPEGICKQNPRNHILTELNELIRKKRLEEYRPVVMMDDNGDYRSPKGNAGILEFIQSAGLVDHHKDKFPEPISSYVHRSK